MTLLVVLASSMTLAAWTAAILWPAQSDAALKATTHRISHTASNCHAKATRWLIGTNPHPVTPAMPPRWQPAAVVTGNRRHPATKTAVKPTQVDVMRLIGGKALTLNELDQRLGLTPEARHRLLAPMFCDSLLTAIHVGGTALVFERKAGLVVGD